MFKALATAAVIGLSSSAASAAVVDVFSLDVTSAAGTDSSVTLDLGTEYSVTVSGRFFLGSNTTRHVADAEFFNLGSSPLNPLDDVTSAEIGVGIDGADVDFGAFDPSSVYTTTVVGDGTTINVFFNDTNYGDNTGSLSVEIAEIAVVPLPAGLALMLMGLGGLRLVRRRRA